MSRGFYISHLPIIYLEETSAKYSSYEEIADNIYNDLINLLEIIVNKNTPIKILKQNDVDFNKKLQFKIQLSAEDASCETNIYVSLSINKTINNIKVKSIKICPISFCLVIPEDFTINDILKEKDYINTIIYQEILHVSKLKRKLQQLIYKMDGFTNNDNKFWYTYHTISNELNDYVSRINNELKQLKQKNKDISLLKALKICKNWKRHTKFVFNKCPKLKNKMLSKLTNYWNTLP